MHSLFFLTFILACGTYVAATLDMANTAALPRHDFLPSRPEQYLSINTNPIYDLIDTYDATNFWDKFNFMEGDPTHGFVLYQNRSEAERLGLIRTSQPRPDSPLGGTGTVSMQVEHQTVIRGPNGLPDGNLTGLGRKSIRIESIKSYAEGLIVADFSHFPEPQCGSWPAFWTYSEDPDWPNGGEIDIYEQWNEYRFNRQSIHMNATLTGKCTFTPSPWPLAPSMTNLIYTPDCNVTFPLNEGCSSWDYEGPHASPQGGVYAILLSPATNSLRVWSWRPGNAPSFANPDPERWGTPGLSIGGGPTNSSGCDVARTFGNQTIVLNLEVCGDAISPLEWAEGGCARRTGWNGCARFAAERPKAFKGVWFGVRSLKVWQVRR